MEINNGKIVELVYTGTLDDGTKFDSNSKENPLKVVMGFNMIIPGLEKELLSLKEGDKKSIRVKAEEAYGVRDEKRVMPVPKTQFPQDMKIEVGMMLMGAGPNQEQIPVVVKEIKDDEVILDTNHPLAGKDLIFDVEILSVEEGNPEKIKEILTKVFGEMPNPKPPEPEISGPEAEHDCANCPSSSCPSKENSSIDELLDETKKE